MRLATWALGKKNKRENQIAGVEDVLLVLGRQLISIPLQYLIVALPYSPSARVSTMYKGYAGRSFEYPKHARNFLDAHPNASQPEINRRALYSTPGEYERLLRPRVLMVRLSHGWTLVPGMTDVTQPYILISYTSVQFQPDRHGAIPFLERMAETLADQEGVNAYWIDYRCRSEKQPE